MSYQDRVNTLSTDPEQLEQIYQGAREDGETDAFKQAIYDNHASAPENLLYAAWFHRLKYAADQAKGFVVAWAAVAFMAVVGGLLAFNKERGLKLIQHRPDMLPQAMLVRYLGLGTLALLAAVLNAPHLLFVTGYVILGIPTDDRALHH